MLTTEQIAEEKTFHDGLLARVAEMGDMVHPYIRKYLDFRPLYEQLPHKAAFGFVLEKVEGFCKDCGQPTTRLRGTVKEWASCIEVEGGGVFHECNLVTYFKMRQYDDGHQLKATDNGWKCLLPRPASLKTQILWCLRAAASRFFKSS